MVQMTDTENFAYNIDLIILQGKRETWRNTTVLKIKMQTSKEEG